MYIVQEKFMEEDNKRDINVRVEIVDYVREWAVGVFKEASKESSISRAGQVVRYYVLEDRILLEEVFNEIFIVDLSDFWTAVGGQRGVRDDIALYGIFCMIFGELDERIGVEGDKLEGEIGYAPKMRIDLSERDTTASGGGFSFKWLKGSKEEKEEVEEEVEEEQIEEDEIVEIEDEYVREDNVQKLTAVVVAVLVVLVVALAWVIII